MIQKWLEKCFGMAGVAKKSVLACREWQNSVLAWQEWQEKCYGVAVVARKVFLRNRRDKKSALAR